MKSGVLKLFLKYWQETVFIGSFGFILLEITKFSLVQNTIDGWDKVLLTLILPLQVCLIGQLFWNSKILATVLSVLLSTGSFVVVLMAFYFIGTTSSKFIQAISMLIVGIFLLFAALTMNKKKLTCC